MYSAIFSYKPPYAAIFGHAHCLTSFRADNTNPLLQNWPRPLTNEYSHGQYQPALGQTIAMGT